MNKRQATELASGHLGRWATYPVDQETEALSDLLLKVANEARADALREALEAAYSWATIETRHMVAALKALAAQPRPSSNPVTKCPETRHACTQRCDTYCNKDGSELPAPEPAQTEACDCPCHRNNEDQQTQMECRDCNGTGRRKEGT